MLSPDRPGYAEIEAAWNLPEDSEAWKAFMWDVVKLPMSMLPLVQVVVQKRSWVYANDPVRALRAVAMSRAKRLHRTSLKGE